MSVAALGRSRHPISLDPIGAHQSNKQWENQKNQANYSFQIASVRQAVRLRTHTLMSDTHTIHSMVRFVPVDGSVKCAA